MKKRAHTLIACLALIAIFNSNAQQFKELDAVPHDIEYLRESNITKPLVKVIYGRPSIDDGKNLKDMVTYGKVWRTGANEATEIKFYQDVLYGGHLVMAGTYVLLTIPKENEWEIILNKNLDVLGAFQYKPDANIASIRVSVSKAERLDVFSIGFKRKENSVSMVLAWDTARVKIPLTFVRQEYYAKL